MVLDVGMGIDRIGKWSVLTYMRKLVPKEIEMENIKRVW